MTLKNLLKKLSSEDRADILFEELKLHIACQLKGLMQKKNLNKKGLAEKMGVSPTYITKIFGGDNISLKTLSKVLVALEIDPIIEIKEFNYTEKQNYDWNKNIEHVTILPVNEKEIDVTGDYNESKEINHTAA